LHNWEQNCYYSAIFSAEKSHFTYNDFFFFFGVFSKIVGYSRTYCTETGNVRSFPPVEFNKQMIDDSKVAALIKDLYLKYIILKSTRIHLLEVCIAVVSSIEISCHFDFLLDIVRAILLD
jgi:hypothetical protein